MFKTSKYEVRSEYLELRKTLSMSMREVYSSSKEGKEIFTRCTSVPYRNCIGCQYFSCFKVLGNLLRKRPGLSHFEEKFLQHNKLVGNLKHIL